MGLGLAVLLPSLTLGEQMNSHNEDKQILNLGRIKIDVSNVPYGKECVAMDQWNEKRREQIKETEDLLIETEEMSTPEQNKRLGDLQAIHVAEFRLLSDSLGIELIRQPLFVLRRRYFILKAIWEYVRRYFITIKTISSMNKKDYDDYDEWVYFRLTGKKKEDLVRQKGLLDLLVEMELELEKKTNLNLEACLELLQTSVEGIAEGLTNSIADHKA